MLNPAERFRKNLETSIEAKRQMLADALGLSMFSQAVEVVSGGSSDRQVQAGRPHLCSRKRGSAADAQHLAAEFVSKLARDRNPLPTETLTTDSSVLTAIGNDYGYEQIFSRQIASKMTARDIFLGITTSGKSPNILKALEQCRAMGIETIIFSGRDGGPAKVMADHCIIAPGTAPSTIQELHIVLAHSLCECVEEAILAISGLTV